MSGATVRDKRTLYSASPVQVVVRNNVHVFVKFTKIEKPFGNRGG